MTNELIKDYIDGVNLSNIEYQSLTANELYDFLNDNYIDKNGFVSSDDSPSKPIGFEYLDYSLLNFSNAKYLIGYVQNNIGKKTIVSYLKYYDNYLFDKEQQIPLTYILTIEVNEYLRRKGLFKQLIKESINHIDINNPVITTIESDLGYKIGIVEIIKKIYYENGFNKDIRSIGECDEQYLEMINNKKRAL